MIGRWYTEATAKVRRVFWTCSSAWALDAMDVALISFIMAALGIAWNLNSTELSVVASIGFVGMALGASLGGLNVLVLRLHDRFGWSTGKVQFAFDAVILLAGAVVTADLRRLGLSVLAVVAINLVLVYNHRKGRYQPS